MQHVARYKLRVTCCIVYDRLKFEAYINHLTSLSQDSSVRSSDRAKLREFCRKWGGAKYLLGCVFFVDLLSPCAIFSKVMQSDDLDVLSAFTSLLHTVKEVNGLRMCKTTKPVANICINATENYCKLKDGKRVYHLQVLSNYDQAKNYYNTHHQEHCMSVTSCLKSRLAWSDLQFIRDVILVLATHG